MKKVGDMTRSVFDFPSNYADAHTRIQLRAVGVMPSRVRRLELEVAGRAEACAASVRVSDEMSLVPVVVGEAGTSWLTPVVLEQWGVSVEHVVSDVLANLNNMSVDIRPVGEGVFVVHGEVFAGMVWGRTELVSGLDVPGNAIMWYAGDGVTLVIGDQVPQGFQIALGVLMERLHSGVELETLIPHRIGDGGWVPSVWPESAHETLAMAQRLFMGQWYERQRKPLQEHYQRQGHEVNVPEYQVMNTPQGEVVSVCACVAGISNMIPDVDTVLLVQLDGSAQAYSFAEFQEQFSASTQDTHVSPPRWWASGE